MHNSGEHRQFEYKQPFFSEVEMDACFQDLQILLKEIGKNHIFDALTYCLHELIDNACKANLKRVFFVSHQLDIQNATDYQRGMANFKSEILTNQANYTAQLEEAGLFIDVAFFLDEKELILHVSNNSVILPSELAKINQRIELARIHHTLTDVFEDISDNSESAGLGIVMLYMILRSLGLPHNSFVITTDDTCTAVTISMPIHMLTDDESEMISETLIEEIHSIPQFPDHIFKLKSIIQSTSFNPNDVLTLIKQDPALTADILRMCNSAYYRRRNKIENCRIAINILGIRGLNAILDSFGARKAMEKKYPAEVLDPIWKHSAETAQITSVLSEHYKLNTDIAEQAYNSALLHEIGRIVLEGRYPETYQALKQICDKKAVSVYAVEHLIKGANHTILGAHLAEKWNLPDPIISTIRYYQLPLSALDELQIIAKIVFLAHTLCSMRHNEDKKPQTDNLPKYFGLSTTDTLSSLLTLVNEKMQSMAI